MLISFFQEKGIEANEYVVRGNGMCNIPFNENETKDIILSIIPTETDAFNFMKMLTKPKDNGLSSFKKNSSIAKEFAKRCVEEQIIINILRLDLRDYFKSLGWSGYNREQFIYEDKLYLKVRSEYLKEDDTPEGFIEIKLSEYYKALEEYENSKEVE